MATYGGELLPDCYSDWLLAALEAWRRYSTPNPFYWQALWPLIGIALAQERPAEAIAHARRLHERGQ